MVRLLVTGGAILLLLTACGSVPSESRTGPQDVRIVSSFWNRPAQAYTWKRVTDPTGIAPTSQVERFTLRDGHCRGWDCDNRRARVERHIITDLQDGDRLRYSYSVYFPSNEFNIVQGVSTTVGQLYLAGNRGNDNGGNPIWDLNTVEGSRTWYMRMLTPIAGTSPIETRTVRRLNIGSIPFDRWVRIMVEARLSTGSDGYIEAFVDGRSVGRSSGRNILPNAYVEYDYGIYQKLHGLLRAGGVREGIPMQVVMYSNVSISRLSEE